MTITKSIGLIFIVLMMITVSVSAGGYAPVVQEGKDGSGVLQVTVRCHNNIFSKEMMLTNDLAPTEGKSIYLDHAGTFNDRLIPGDYTIKLLDGNGGQPETQKFRIDEGYTSYVTFIGHAASDVGKQPEPVNDCQDLVITTGDIHRVFFLSWFRIHVSNPNDVWTKSDVVITDSMGHVVFDYPIYAPPGGIGGSGEGSGIRDGMGSQRIPGGLVESYSFLWAAANSHNTHNPLTASVSGTVCREPQAEQ